MSIMHSRSHHPFIVRGLRRVAAWWGSTKLSSQGVLPVVVLACSNS
jgi:hypothetical protein